MVEGVIDSPENIAGRFKVGARVAARVGALLGVGVQVSPALLEETARKPKVADFLVSDELYEAARAGLDALKRFVASFDGVDLAGDRGSVLALSEEIVAARTLPPALRTPGGMVRVERIAASRNLPFINEILLSVAPGNEEIRAAKIKFLTGRAAGERLEALRKILLSPLSPAEKASILFFALRDEEHQVIGEAIKAFKGIGLSEALADTLIELIRGPVDRRADSIDLLVREAGSARDREADVLVAVTGRLIRDEEFQPFKARLLKVLRALMRGREGAPEEIAEIVRLLIRHVPLDLEDSQLTLRELFLSIAKGKPRALCDILWDEVESQRTPGRRTFLLTLLGRVETRRTALERLDRVLVTEEIPRLVEAGEDMSILGYVLKRRSTSLFPKLMAMAHEAGEERRSVLLRAVADAFDGADLADSARLHQARSLLALAERSGRLVRQVILRAGIHRAKGLQESVRRRFAPLFLGLLEPEFYLEHNHEVWGAMRELGWSAGEALADFVASEANDMRLRKDSLAALREFLTREDAYPAEEKAIAKIVSRIQAMIAEPGFTLRDDATPLLGAALLNRALPRKDADRIATRLVRRLREQYCPGDVGALPYVARSTRVPQELKQRMVRRLLKILDEGEDAKVTKESHSAEGRLIELQDGGPIHTQQIPSAIEALKDAALSLASSDPGPAYMITRTLMRKWDEVLRWERVWGLGSREALVRALGEMAGSQALPPSLAAEILVYLTRRFLASPMEPFLAEAVALPLRAGRFENAGGIAARILKKLLEVADDQETVGQADAGRLLLAAASVASASPSPIREGPERALAAQLIDILERRARFGFPEDRKALDLLAEAEDLPRKLKERAVAARVLRERLIVQGDDVPQGDAGQETRGS